MSHLTRRSPLSARRSLRCSDCGSWMTKSGKRSFLSGSTRYARSTRTFTSAAVVAILGGTSSDSKQPSIRRATGIIISASTTRSALSVADVVAEVGKLLYYASQGQFSLPDEYFFVAPQGPSTALIKCLQKGT